MLDKDIKEARTDLAKSSFYLHSPTSSVWDTKFFILVEFSVQYFTQWLNNFLGNGLFLITGSKVRFSLQRSDQ